MQQDEAIVRRQLTTPDAAAINAILLEFFKKVYDKTGYPRPEGLHCERTPMGLLISASRDNI
jgi:hypothetical protein